MRLLAIPLTILFLASSVPAVDADPGHERPRITVMRWQSAPVTVPSGGCGPDGTCEEEILIIKAHDPDSSITEIQVMFDEKGGNAPIVFAHSYCVQGKEPGEPARMELGVSYSEPGEYTVAAVAYSHRSCLGHEDGDGHPSLHSKVKRIHVTVEAAE